MSQRCPYEKRCGGCQLLSLPYEQQLAQKKARCQELLGAFGPCQPILGMEEPSHYRNKAIATFAPAGKGKFVLGIYARHSHRVQPVEDCLLQDPLLNEALKAVAQAAAECHLPAYDEDRRRGLLRHVVLRSSRLTGQVLLTVVTAQEQFPGSRNFTSALRRRCPAVASVVQNVNPAKTSAVLGPWSKTLYGPGQIIDRLCGLDFAISSGSFYQVNPLQTERLYQKALELAQLGPKDRVLDAYCGIGTIGLCAAPHCEQVVGVELNADAVADAKSNARRNHITNARFLAQDATAFLCQLAEAGERADVLFMDPPRSGSTKDFLSAAAKMGPKRIVYISCNPETQARDLGQLSRLGYQVDCLQPVDLFPQTEHVECIAALSKAKR